MGGGVSLIPPELSILIPDHGRKERLKSPDFIQSLPRHGSQALSKFWKPTICTAPSVGPGGRSSMLHLGLSCLHRTSLRLQPTASTEMTIPTPSAVATQVQLLSVVRRPCGGHGHLSSAHVGDSWGSAHLPTAWPPSLGSSQLTGTRPGPGATHLQPCCCFELHLESRQQSFLFPSENHSAAFLLLM